MTPNEEAIHDIQEFMLYTSLSKNDLSDEMKEALNTAIEALKGEPCEDCVSREAVLKITAETGALETQARVKALPPVTPKQKTLDWIPVKDPYTELPKKDMLWVTRNDRGCRWVDTIYYDMTEWSDEINDVVAYAIYEEPEPYKEGESE